MQAPTAAAKFAVESALQAEPSEPWRLDERRNLLLPFWLVVTASVALVVILAWFGMKLPMDEFLPLLQKKTADSCTSVVRTWNADLSEMVYHNISKSAMRDVLNSMEFNIQRYVIERARKPGSALLGHLASQHHFEDDWNGTCSIAQEVGAARYMWASMASQWYAHGGEGDFGGILQSDRRPPRTPKVNILFADETHVGSSFQSNIKDSHQDTTTLRGCWLFRRFINSPTIETRTVSAGTTAHVECRQACEDYSGCNRWSVITTNGTCYFKNGTGFVLADGESEWDPNAVSGFAYCNGEEEVIRAFGFVNSQSSGANGILMTDFEYWQWNADGDPDNVMSSQFEADGSSVTDQPEYRMHRQRAADALPLAEAWTSARIENFGMVVSWAAPIAYCGDYSCLSGVIAVPVELSQLSMDSFLAWARFHELLEQYQSGITAENSSVFVVARRSRQASQVGAMMSCSHGCPGGPPQDIDQECPDVKGSYTRAIVESTANQSSLQVYQDGCQINFVYNGNEMTGTVLWNQSANNGQVLVDGWEIPGDISPLDSSVIFGDAEQPGTLVWRKDLIVQAVSSTIPPVSLAASAILSRFRSWDAEALEDDQLFTFAPNDTSTTYGGADTFCGAKLDEIQEGTKCWQVGTVTVTLDEETSWLVVVLLPATAFITREAEVAANASKEVKEILQQSRRDVEEAQQWACPVLVATLLLGTCLAACLGLHITARLRELTEQTQRVSELDFDHSGEYDQGSRLWDRLGWITCKSTPPRCRGETRVSDVNQLQQAFGNLERGIKAFARFVPEPVVRCVVQGQSIKSEPREVTILSSDIENFTSLSEDLKPPQLLFLLTRYFSVMHHTVKIYQGVVAEILGDGLIVYWNTPNDVDNHAAKACAAALAMQEAVEKMNVEMVRMGLPRLAIRIGIHTDTVLSGPVGSDIAKKFGCLGKATGIAEHFECACKAYGVSTICSAQTFEQLPRSDPVFGGFRCRQISATESVDDVDEPLTIYEVVSRDLPLDPAMAHLASTTVGSEQNGWGSLDSLATLDSTENDEPLPSRFGGRRLGTFGAQVATASWASNNSPCTPSRALDTMKSRRSNASRMSFGPQLSRGSRLGTMTMSRCSSLHSNLSVASPEPASRDAAALAVAASSAALGRRPSGLIADSFTDNFRWSLQMASQVPVASSDDLSAV